MECGIRSAGPEGLHQFRSHSFKAKDGTPASSGTASTAIGTSSIGTFSSSVSVSSFAPVQHSGWPVHPPFLDISNYDILPEDLCLSTGRSERSAWDRRSRLANQRLTAIGDVAASATSGSDPVMAEEPDVGCASDMASTPGSDGGVGHMLDEEFAGLGRGTEDLQGVDNNNLLVMLDELSRTEPGGAHGGSECAEAAKLGSAKLDAECQALQDEVQAERERGAELQMRLYRELRQIQERSDRQQQESEALVRRLNAARDLLDSKLRAAEDAEQGLRGGLAQETETRASLQQALSEFEERTAERSANLGRRIRAAGAAQVSLVDQLEEATAAQASLQRQLRDERAAAWKQSAEQALAAARKGGEPSAAGDDDGLEEQDRLRRQHALQAEAIAKLRRRLGEELEAAERLDEELQATAAGAAECGVELRQGIFHQHHHPGGCGEESTGEEVLALAMLAARLRRELSDASAELAEASAELRSREEAERRRLEGEELEAQEAARGLEAYLANQSAWCREQESHLEDLEGRLGAERSAAAELLEALAAERDALREAEQAEGNARCQGQELARLAAHSRCQREAIDRLQLELDRSTASCFGGSGRRRSPPPRPAAGARGAASGRPR